MEHPKSEVDCQPFHCYLSSLQTHSPFKYSLWSMNSQIFLLMNELQSRATLACESVSATFSSIGVNLRWLRCGGGPIQKIPPLL